MRHVHIWLTKLIGARLYFSPHINLARFIKSYSNTAFFKEKGWFDPDKPELLCQAKLGITCKKHIQEVA